MKSLKILKISVLAVALIVCLYPLTTLAAPPSNSTAPVVTPFQVTLNADFAFDGMAVSKSFTVPADKHLVIEYVSGGVATDAGNVNSFAVQTTVNGVPVDYYIPFLSTLGGGGGSGEEWGHSVSWLAGQTMRIYADPGTQVTAKAYRYSLGAGGQASFWANISGYLESVK